MYELLGICLALATFFAVNALASLAASACWRLLEPRARGWLAHTRSEVLFALRIAAPVAALVFVGFLFVPAYVGYEPHATSEVVSKKLAALAIVSAIGLTLALWRRFRSWSATRALKRKWLNIANEIELPGINIPTFQIAHSFPIIAVLGTFRPRLFIADQVLQCLNEEELAAALAHECGHLAAGDNFKRALLRACRDALMIPCGRSLDRAWSESAEAAADEHAAQQSSEIALNLASALIRIARLVPSGARPEMPLAVFLVGEETRGVKARVRRLLEIASSDRISGRRNQSIVRLMPALSIFALSVLAVAIESNPHVLAKVHSVIEHVVSILS